MLILISGTDRIRIGYGELDLVGEPHYSKILQKYIETPHVKTIEFNFSGVKKGFIPKANKDLTRSATMEDLIRAIKIINNDF